MKGESVWNGQPSKSLVVGISGLNLQGTGKKTGFIFTKEVKQTIFHIKVEIRTFSWISSKSFDALKNLHTTMSNDGVLCVGSGSRKREIKAPFPAGKEGESDVMVLVERKEMIENYLKEVVENIDYRRYQPLAEVLEIVDGLQRLSRMGLTITRAAKRYLRRQGRLMELFKVYSPELMAFVTLMENGIEVFSASKAGPPDVLLLPAGSSAAASSEGATSKGASSEGSISKDPSSDVVDVGAGVRLVGGSLSPANGASPTQMIHHHLSATPGHAHGQGQGHVSGMEGTPPEMLVMWLDICEEPSLSRLCVGPRRVFELPRQCEDERLTNGIYLSDIAEVRRGAASFNFLPISTPWVKPELCVSVVGSERTLDVQFASERSLTRFHFIDMLNLLALQALTPREIRLRGRTFRPSNPCRSLRVDPIVSHRARLQRGKLLEQAELLTQLLIKGIEVDEETFSPFIGYRTTKRLLEYSPHTRKLYISSIVEGDEEDGDDEEGEEEDADRDGYEEGGGYEGNGGDVDVDVDVDVEERNGREPSLGASGNGSPSPMGVQHSLSVDTFGSIHSLHSLPRPSRGSRGSRGSMEIENCSPTYRTVVLRAQDSAAKSAGVMPPAGTSGVAELTSEDRSMLIDDIAEVRPGKVSAGVDGDENMPFFSLVASQSVLCLPVPTIALRDTLVKRFKAFVEINRDFSLLQQDTPRPLSQALNPHSLPRESKCESTQLLAGDRSSNGTSTPMSSPIGLLVSSTSPQPAQSHQRYPATATVTPMRSVSRDRASLLSNASGGRTSSTQALDNDLAVAAGAAAEDGEEGHVTATKAAPGFVTPTPVATAVPPAYLSEAEQQRWQFQQQQQQSQFQSNCNRRQNSTGSKSRRSFARLIGSFVADDTSASRQHSSDSADGRSHSRSDFYSGDSGTSLNSSHSFIYSHTVQRKSISAMRRQSSTSTSTLQSTLSDFNLEE